MAHLQWRRWVLFVLLAAGMAHAINKLFIPELTADEPVYLALIQGNGPAPDQYRILPILLLAPFVHALGWSHGVLVSSFVAGMIVLFQFWQMTSHRNENQRLLFLFLFSAGFIFTLVTGWRPETLWVMAALNACIPRILDADRNKAGFLISVIILSLVRADVTVWACICAGAFQPGNWRWSIMGIFIGSGMQVVLMKLVFPQAQYYTHLVMVWDNLSGWYFLRNPATYFILGALLMGWTPVVRWFRSLPVPYRRMVGVALSYGLLIFFVGRINEYRLYLWMLPAFWWLDRRMNTVSHE